MSQVGIHGTPAGRAATSPVMEQQCFKALQPTMKQGLTQIAEEQMCAFYDSTICF